MLDFIQRNAAVCIYSDYSIFNNEHWHVTYRDETSNACKVIVIYLATAAAFKIQKVRDDTKIAFPTDKHVQWKHLFIKLDIVEPGTQRMKVKSCFFVKQPKDSQFLS